MRRLGGVLVAFLVAFPGAFLCAQTPEVDYPLNTKRKPAEDPRTYQFTRVNGSGASGDLSSAGSKTISLSPCPLYVAGTDSFHYVRISGGVGTAEAALITGGTCTSGLSSGTIVVTTANSHTGAWQVTSSSDGIQEAVLASGTYGGVNLGCQTYEVYAPIHISYHVSLAGCGMDTTYLHNNSTTTGVINYTALIISGRKTPFGGVEFSGFTIYAGAAGNSDVDTVNADAIYVLGSDWNLVISNVFIQNHDTGIRTVNTWSSRIEGGGCRFFKSYCIYTETDSEVGSGTEAGAGAGGDQKLNQLNISNVGGTNAQTATGCGVRYANWAGVYIDGVTVTATPYGLCLQPRAAHGTETFTQIYYGQVQNSQFDTTALGGILIDSTSATSGGITTIKFNNVISSFNGCLTNCTAAPYTNAAHGVYFHATAGKVIRDISFVGSEFRENGGHGVLTDGTAYINSLTFIGDMADNNSQAADNTYDGFHFGDNNFQITLQGSTAGVVNTTLLVRHPRYGVYTGSALTQAQITGNTFYPLNQTGPCRVTSDVVLNDISYNYPLTDTQCNYSYIIPGAIGTNVASAGTITPTVGAGGVFHVTGTATISTINTPTPFAFGGTLCLIADGAWATDLLGNIGFSFTATAGQMYCFAYDSQIASKWYPTGGGSGGGGTIAGDVTGGLGAATVVKFQNRAMAATAPADTNVICWDAGGTTWKPCSAATGTGTVTSVGFTGGLISVATATTMPAFTIAGTSGGVPYFNSATTWATSAALTANLPVIGGGAGAAPAVGSRTGNTTQFATSTGSQTANAFVTIDASGNHVATSPAFTTQTDGATITWALASAPVAHAKVTLAGNRALNITGALNGGEYVLNVVQDGSGSHGLTLGTGCTWKVSGGGGGAISPSTGANAIDQLRFNYDGTNCYAVYTKNFN